MGVNERFITYGGIPSEGVAEWLEDKDYILCTSINEGNPNNIIEAMAMGIKPIIHNFPGAKEQFPDDLIFTETSGALIRILENKYEPEKYRDWVKERYDLSNFSKIHDVIEFATK